jgi:hypothetical protein
MIVLKPFNSIHCRFKKGDKVSPSHDLNPHTADDLVKRGFLKVEKPGEANVPVAASVEAEQSAKLAIPPKPAA